MYVRNIYVGDQLRTSFEPASVMEFGFNQIQKIKKNAYETVIFHRNMKIVPARGVSRYISKMLFLSRLGRPPPRLPWQCHYSVVW